MTRKQILKDLGKMICEAREKAGITQLSLGVELGFRSGQFISSVERGLKLLPPKHIPTVAKTLKIDSREIYDRLMSIERMRLEGRMTE